MHRHASKQVCIQATALGGVQDGCFYQYIHGTVQCINTHKRWHIYHLPSQSKTIISSSVHAGLAACNQTLDLAN